jgi:uncharacterized protein YbcV (DUF1398 family)
MFTIVDIKTAHAKVKSGADYPAYVQDLIKLGVAGYETFVHDNHTEYFGTDGIKAGSLPSGEELAIANQADKETFLNDLKAHQQGKTDYPRFRKDCAKSGVDKWTADLSKMTCTYFDKSGKSLLVEKIPGV